MEKNLSTMDKSKRKPFSSFIYNKKHLLFHCH